MDMYSTIIFGDFTEEERLLLFSDESVKSSCIEFPEEWNLFIPACGLCGEHECTKTESDISSRVENVDSSSGLTTEGELREELRREDDAPGEFWHGLTSKENVDEQHEPLQVSESNDVLSVQKFDVSNASDSAKSNPTPITQSEEKTLKDECVPNVMLHNNVVENGETPGVKATDVRSYSQSAEPCGPTNVVTVGTKTIMTTSTRTAQSRNEGVKSSWADLFKTKPSSKLQGPLALTKPPEKPQQVGDGVEDNLSKNDQFQQYFLDVLRKVSLTNRVPSLQPRGLKNNGNWCYINSTLQVLLFCPSFYHFLMKFKLKTDRGTSFTPILDALVVFASQFSEMLSLQHSTGKSRDWSKQDVVMGMPFEPMYVYKLLTRVKTSLSQQGKQEDAEEFLSCILNGLHDEMAQLATQGATQPDTASKPAIAEQAVGEWEQVGPRNRSTVTRKATISKSPVAAMFGGYLRSSLVQPGMKESASIQPFFTIQLDLRGEVSTVQQAFDNFFRVEEVEGFQCDKSKTEVEVSKKWTLDTLPVVLVLHLKRFVVNKNGCEKLTKKISYEPQLQVPLETLSKGIKVRSKNILTYKLFAVTYHHGKNLHGGHYTSDISHPAVGWLRADDMNVRTVPPKFVFNPLSNRDPYLLYYCRGDISLN